MSRRKRKLAPPSPKQVLPLTAGQKLLKMFTGFIRTNVRVMAIAVGGGMLAQALVPWTTRGADNLWFIIAGAVLLGLSIPENLWK